MSESFLHGSRNAGLSSRIEVFGLRRLRGFTLVELLVVISIAAILMLIAVPSFDSVIKRNQIDSLQSQLSSAVAGARNEAMSRNSIITLCRSNGNEECGNSWNNGWITFVDTDGDGVHDEGELITDVYRHNSNYLFSVADSENTADVSHISFGYQGFLHATNATLITICEPKKNVSFARGLYVNLTGAVMKTRDGTDTGTNHDNPLVNNADLSCT